MKIIKYIKTIGFAWYVDDIKSSHIDPKVNYKFQEWCQKVYGKFGEVKVVREKLHDYLAMILGYTAFGELSVDVKYFIDKIKEDIPFVN